ncbi:MAG: hypothetical protein JWO05_2696 [Gemmatimonadetes bacterium]|nr:hypothetical protein [Gemmatimonadota bacterium]
MSIDLYPALDLGDTEVAVALERTAIAGAVAPVGAASLLHRNSDEYWPDHAADDLVTRHPGITFLNLAEDGASVGDVFGGQLVALEESDEPTLVTLTVGGNDLLSAFANKPKLPLLMQIARDVGEACELLVDAIRAQCPDSLVIVNTVYDPSDGTRQIEGAFEHMDELPIEALDALNARLREIGRGRGALLADAYEHFLGHGAKASPEERWYWKRSPIEPNAAGANGLRELWLATLDANE